MNEKTPDISTPEGLSVPPVIIVENLSKTFILHQQGGVEINAISDISFSVAAGECVALHGPSGAGKSTLLRTLYGNYLPTSGAVYVRWGESIIDIVKADPRTIIRMRQRCLGYVSQFLRVIPRVTSLDLVAEPLLEVGCSQSEARAAGAAIVGIFHDDMAREAVANRLVCLVS